MNPTECKYHNNGHCGKECCYKQLNHPCLSACPGFAPAATQCERVSANQEKETPVIK